MKTFTIKPADQEQENLVVSFLHNLRIDFEEQATDTNSIESTDVRPSESAKKVSGDAWRFGT